jgi:hypothetical protein
LAINGAKNDRIARKRKMIEETKPRLFETKFFHLRLCKGDSDIHNTKTTPQLYRLIAPKYANDRPLAVKFQDKLHFPVFSVYSEVFFGGDFETEANYRDSYVQNLIRANGNKELSTAENSGWIFWPPIRFNARTINYAVDYHPSPPSKVNWLGTDDQGREKSYPLFQQNIPE